jgi:hypothetical protein
MALQLLRRTTCPHCWTAFAPEEVLWVSAHSDLLGDPRLGLEQLQRFLPTRFDLNGNAIDAKGFPCHTLACPKCHLAVPRAVLEMEPTFVSILGTPACGKSYYLTALTWELRRLLPVHFGLSFTEADTVSNRHLSEYEESLFLNPRAQELVPLADLIRKTDLQGELYDTVMYGDQAVSYPRPFLFTMQPLKNHPHFGRAEKMARNLCLYDNAGEHFLTGQDSTASPVTHHMTHSKLLMFLFDPTQDQRFRSLCQLGKGDSANTASGRTSRQESTLLEAAARVRRYTGLPQNAKHQRPLIVAVTKLDAWRHLLADKDWQEPWIAKDRIAGIDVEKIEKRSQDTRGLLFKICPEMVHAAEGFAQQVVYIPVSALGRIPEPDPQTNNLALRPGEIKPIWVTVPLLYGFCRWLPGLIPSLRRKQRSAIADRSPEPERRGKSIPIS